MDLPGIYSLTPYSPEEALAGNFLCGKAGFDYQYCGCLEFGTESLLDNPIDGTEYSDSNRIKHDGRCSAAGDHINCGLFSSLIGAAAVPISASKGRGLKNCFGPRWLRLNIRLCIIIFRSHSHMS